MIYSLRHLVNVLGGSADGSDHRHDPRRPVRGIQCSGGEILDFSASGMRIESKRAWKPGKVRWVSLSAKPFTMSIRASAVWSKREGWRRHVVGLTFVEVGPHEAELLALLVARHGLELAARAG